MYRMRLIVAILCLGFAGHAAAETQAAEMQDKLTADRQLLLQRWAGVGGARGQAVTIARPTAG